MPALKGSEVEKIMQAVDSFAPQDLPQVSTGSGVHCYGLSVVVSVITSVTEQLHVPALKESEVKRSCSQPIALHLTDCHRWVWVLFGMLFVANLQTE